MGHREMGKRTAVGLSSLDLARAWLLISVPMLTFGCLKSATAPPGVDSGGRSSSPMVEGASTPRSETDPIRGASPRAAESPGTSSEHPSPRPDSPFRLVLDEPYGYSLQHDGRRLYVSERGLVDLTNGSTLFACQVPRGYFLSGKTLFFAARMSPYSACPDSPFLLEQAGNDWKLRRYIDAHQILMTEWSGSTIAAVAPYRSGPPWGYELVKVSGGAVPPRAMRATSKSPDAAEYCHSELQYPIGINAFPSRTLYVVGDFRCDHLTPSEDPTEDPETAEKSEADREQLQRELGRPAIEVFPKGRTPSRMVTLPLDDVISIEEAPGDALWILGKVDSNSSNESGAEASPGEHQVLVYFDGTRGTVTSASMLGVRALVSGPASPAADAPAATGHSPDALPAPHGLWVLDEETLRRIDTSDGALVLPTDCNPSDAWFIGEHAWVQCETGLHSTDPGRSQIVVEATDESCEALDPRPTYSVAGLYKRASSGAGCGNRPAPRPGSKLGTDDGLFPPDRRHLDFSY